VGINWVYRIRKRVQTLDQARQQFEKSSNEKGMCEVECSWSDAKDWWCLLHSRVEKQFVKHRRLQKKGLAILIPNNTCKLFLMLAAMPPKESIAFFQTSEEGETQLWHNMFAHFSFKGLRTLYYKKMVKGLPSLKAPTKVY